MKHKPEDVLKTSEAIEIDAEEAQYDEFQTNASEIEPEPTEVGPNPEDHPEWTRPGTQKHPKQIILYRADAIGARQKQSAVILQPDTVGEVLVSAHVPAGYEILSPLTGEILSHGELLYDHVMNGTTVQLIGE